MRRRELLRRLAEAALEQGVSFEYVREGGNHSIYTFGGRRIPIGRHVEIPERVAQKILRGVGA